jgi:predicted Fe-S protein YdhL (DUF1289 family)
MTEDLATMPPESFLRLAVQRGGLDLEELAAGLSPDAAEALRRIAGSANLAPPAEATRDLALPTAAKEMPRSAPPRRSAGARPAARERKCPACGRSNHLQDRFCRGCGRELDEPAPFVTLNDMVAQGQLTPEQAEEVVSTLLFHQSHYLAGTRYSIFGGPR